MKKMCSKCGINERFSNYNSYCRPCKNAMDLKSYHKNNDERKQYARKYVKNHPDKKEKNRLLIKKWFAQHPGYVAQWQIEKVKTDPQYYLRNIINSSINSYMKNNHSENPIWYLGCTIEEFKQHIEKQFDENMNWDNKGRFGWHIDHIIPVNTFDLTDEDQIKKCWHFSNLRPLWWKDNLTRPKDGSDIIN